MSMPVLVRPARAPDRADLAQKSLLVTAEGETEMAPRWRRETDVLRRAVDHAGSHEASACSKVVWMRQGQEVL